MVTTDVAAMFTTDVAAVRGTFLEIRELGGAAGRASARVTDMCRSAALGVAEWIL